MGDWEKCSAVESNPLKMGGAWVFVGTRVRIDTLFNHLKAGATIHEFVEWFPGVDKQQVLAVLDHEARSLRAEAAP